MYGFRGAYYQNGLFCFVRREREIITKSLIDNACAPKTKPETLKLISSAY